MSINDFTTMRVPPAPTHKINPFRRLSIDPLESLQELLGYNWSGLSDKQIAIRLLNLFHNSSCHNSSCLEERKRAGLHLRCYISQIIRGASGDTTSILDDDGSVDFMIVFPESEDIEEKSRIGVVLSEPYNITEIEQLIPQQELWESFCSLYGGNYCSQNRPSALHIPFSVSRILRYYQPDGGLSLKNFTHMIVRQEIHKSDQTVNKWKLLITEVEISSEENESQKWSKKHRCFRSLSPEFRRLLEVYKPLYLQYRERLSGNRGAYIDPYQYNGLLEELLNSEGEGPFFNDTVELWQRLDELADHVRNFLDPSEESLEIPDKDGRLVERPDLSPTLLTPDNEDPLKVKECAIIQQVIEQVAPQILAERSRSRYRWFNDYRLEFWKLHFEEGRSESSLCAQYSQELGYSTSRIKRACGLANLKSSVSRSVKERLIILLRRNSNLLLPLPEEQEIDDQIKKIDAIVGRLVPDNRNPHAETRENTWNSEFERLMSEWIARQNTQINS